MAKELYLYQAIWGYTAESLMNSLEENSREDITLRINSPGGSIFAGWGIAAKMREKKTGKITVKVDGMAASMAAVLTLFADEVIASDVSAFMLHRGDGPVNSAEDQQWLDDRNKDLRAKMEKKINSDKLKELKGHSIGDLFDSAERIDVWLNAKEAKLVGLVDSITKIAPREAEALAQAAAEAYTTRYNIAANTNPSLPMTIEKLKNEHPDIYAKVVGLGVTQERDRASAWANFSEVDPEAVKKGIAAGDALTQTQMVEFMQKQFKAATLGNLGADTKKNATGSTAAETDADKLKAAALEKDRKEFNENVAALTGIKLS